MASKRFSSSILVLLLALICFHPLSTFSFAQQEAVAPLIIRVKNALLEKKSSHVRIQFKAGGAVKGSTELNPGQEYQLQADVVNGVYYASAFYGIEFVSFHAYEPNRDKGHSTIYWSVDEWGFSISYDGRNWKKVATWETE